MEISSYMILHLPTTLTTSLTFRKNSQTLYSPEKTCVIEKTVFLKNFIVCINNICIAMFCYEMDGRSCYVYIKDFNRFMFHKTKNKNKKYFCKSCLQCFSSKNVLTKHKEVCLSINGAQSVRLEKGTIEFKNYFKQIPVPFKIYADFECNLRGVESYEGSYTKKYQDHIPCSFAYKVVCVDDRFTKPIVVYRGENAAYEFIKVILKEYKYCRKVMNKHFNKNLIISEEEEHLF